ncbi:MAG: hypothetical protein ACFBSG_09090 [Leptolyngbyaceae cyanobacterium]
MDSNTFVSPGPARNRLPLREYLAIAHAAKNAARYVSPIRAIAQAILSPRRRVLCKPRHLRHKMMLAKIFAVNGYRPVFDAQQPYDLTFGIPSTDGKYVINGRHRDNKKSRVAKAWADAAGYTLAVDPLTYTGAIVEKSEKNATHDGRIVWGPLQPADVVAGKVYQRLIDNSADDEVVDLRAVICGGKVLLVYIKRRPAAIRFANTNTAAELREPVEIFSAEELAALARFTDKVGIEYGELDVLRDNSSGLIYVVDATNGPAGPPKALSRAEAKAAVARIAIAFDQEIEARQQTSIVV